MGSADVGRPPACSAGASGGVGPGAGGSAGLAGLDDDLGQELLVGDEVGVAGRGG